MWFYIVLANTMHFLPLLAFPYTRYIHQQLNCGSIVDWCVSASVIFAVGEKTQTRAKIIFNIFQIDEGRGFQGINKPRNY